MGELFATAPNCSFSGYHNVSNDTRYEKVGYTISEYDLQKSNGVLDVLEKRQHYTFSVFPGSSIKTHINYELY